MSGQEDEYYYDRSMFFKELSQSIGKFDLLPNLNATNCFLFTFTSFCYKCNSLKAIGTYKVYNYILNQITFTIFFLFKTK